jgi:hypothetical protein
MPFYPDLYSYPATAGQDQVTVHYVGWLSIRHKHTRGDSHAALLPLKAAARSPIFVTGGHHTCDWCGYGSPHSNGEIWFRVGAAVYEMPAMVVHYIEAHEYALPPELNEALVSRRAIALAHADAEAIVCHGDSHIGQRPRARTIASWRESRFADLMRLTRELAGTPFRLDTAVVQDGWYHAEVSDGRALAESFEDLAMTDPLLVPDRVTLTLDDATLATVVARLTRW